MTGRVSPRSIAVSGLSLRATRGWLTCGGLRFPCALGRSGRARMKREGDGATPIGAWPARMAFYRADRVRRPRTGLPVRAMRPSDGWCETPGDRNYNRLIRHPYPSSAETMWRKDGLYDLVVVLGYNDGPRVQGRGSAIFMHVAREGFGPTEGCVALRRADLIRVLAVLRRNERLRVN